MYRIITLLLLCVPLYLQAKSLEYELLDEAGFRSMIAGNTVVGVTRQSNSLYKLYFAHDGTCELFKQNALYKGLWWTSKDESGDDIIHAYWPEYTSQDERSLFNSQHPRYGSPTSVRYYIAKEAPYGLLLVTKSIQVHALLVPGKQ